MQQLPNQRAKRASGLNDRAFGAERTACPDGDGRRDRLEQCHFRFDPATIYQHRFHRFGNAVAFDLRRSILRHYADYQAADHRNENHPRAQMVTADAPESCRYFVEEKQVGEQPDELVKDVGNKSRQQSDPGCKKRHQRNAKACDLRRRQGRNTRCRQGFRHLRTKILAL